MKVAGLISRTLTISENTISRSIASASPSNSALRASMRVRGRVAAHVGHDEAGARRLRRAGR